MCERENEEMMESGGRAEEELPYSAKNRIPEQPPAIEYDYVVL